MKPSHPHQPSSAAIGDVTVFDTPGTDWQPHDPLLREMLHDRVAMGDVVQLLATTALLAEPDAVQRRIFVDSVTWAAQYDDLFLGTTLDLLRDIVEELAPSWPIVDEELATLACELTLHPDVTHEQVRTVMAAARTPDGELGVAACVATGWIAAAATLVHMWTLAVASNDLLADRAIAGYLLRQPWHPYSVPPLPKSEQPQLSDR